MADILLVDKIDQIISKWLDETCKRSEKTCKAYSLVMTHFRETLHNRGLDVFSEPDKIGTVANDYAHYSYDNRGRIRNGSLSENTINQRLAILSSFYTFCCKWNDQVVNPIERYCKYEKRNVHDRAHAIEIDTIDQAMQEIDRTTLIGKRNYALLALALTTGRRASELVRLTWNDIRIYGKKMEVTWIACKGNKTMKDILGDSTRDILIEWLIAFYKTDLGTLDNNAPIFVSLSHNGYGKQMSTQAVSNICEKHLGTSKVHATRHTFAITSEKAGASLSEIGERLGHESLKTTSEYMKTLHSAENKHVGKIEKLYGF